MKNDFTTEGGLAEELMAVQEDAGFDEFCELWPRVAGRGEETVCFNVWISLWGARIR